MATPPEPQPAPREPGTPPSPWGQPGSWAPPASPPGWARPVSPPDWSRPGPSRQVGYAPTQQAPGPQVPAQYPAPFQPPPGFPAIPAQRSAPPPGLETPPAGLEGTTPIYIGRQDPRSRRQLLALVAGALVLIGGGAALLWPVVNTGAAAPTAPIAPTGPVAAAPAVPAPTDPASARQAVSTWYRNGGESRMTALVRDMKAIQNALGAQDVPGMRAGCESLQRSVEGAQAYDPMPDAQAQQHLAASLALTARSATDCVAAISTADGDLLRQSVAELAAATVETRQVTARLQVLKGN